MLAKLSGGSVVGARGRVRPGAPSGAGGQCVLNNELELEVWEIGRAHV